MLITVIISVKHPHVQIYDIQLKTNNMNKLCIKDEGTLQKDLRNM